MGRTKRSFLISEQSMTYELLTDLDKRFTSTTTGIRTYNFAVRKNRLDELPSI